MRLEEFVGQDKISIINASITKVFLGFDEHGIFIFNIYLKSENPGFMVFGGHNLVWGGYGTQLLVEIMQTFGVVEWNKLVTQPVRVLRFGSGHFNSKIDAIGHFIDDSWVYPKAMSDAYLKENS